MSADIFGDASLFDEFEKERDVRSTYIKEDHVDRGAIVFNTTDLQPDSESSIGSSDSEEDTEQVENGTSSNQMDQIQIQIDGEQNSLTNETNQHNSNNDAHSDSGSVPPSVHTSDIPKPRTISKIGNIKFTLHKTVIYDDDIVDEENTNEYGNIDQTHQSFSRLVDSSRLCVDEESPAVQVLYQNNHFSRMYRHRIEAFIQSLLETERQKDDPKSLPDIDLLPSAKSTLDMKEDNRHSNSIRKAHIVLGYSHFYRKFIFDPAGWPLVNCNPCLTDSWVIPPYEQAFETSLPYSEEDEGAAVKKVSRPKPTCFNCGGDHILAACKEERNHRRIAENRRTHMERSPAGNPHLSLQNRYHIEDDPRFASFKPGEISEDLRRALGLRHHQLPEHIYSMRLLGYPPGWLLEARDQASGIAMFDKHGREVSVTGDSLEDGEVKQDQSPEVDIVPSKIIEYPGFTVPVPEGFIDEHHLFRMPPIQPHQLKRTVEKTVQQQEETLKRKAKDLEDIKTKRSRCDNSNLLDMDVDEDSDSLRTRSAPATPTPCSLMTPPPLPTDTPPVRPPLPDGTPPATPPPPMGGLFRSPLRLPPPKGTSPASTPPGSSPRQISVDSSSSEGALLEDLETQYRSIVSELESCPKDDINNVSEVDIERIDSISSPESDAQVVDSPDIIEIPSQPSSPFTDLDVPSPTTANDLKIHNKSIEMKFGTPILQAAVLHPGLPSREQFADGAEEHLLFENLPESTGTFERMRGLLANIKKKLNVSKKKKT